MYHSIGGVTKEIGAGAYAVLVDSFKKQMAYACRVNVLLTFDDGLADNYSNAFPILKESGLKSYFFVMPDKLGTDGYMSWAQVKELAVSGMIIGSHGMSHRILTGLTTAELEHEINGSKSILEDKLRQKVEYFSIPRGFVTKAIIDRIKDAGYRAVFTSNPNDSDGFRIGRIAVRHNWNIEKFKYVIENGLPLKDRVVDGCKNTIKNLLGSKAYDRLRSKLIS